MIYVAGRGLVVLSSCSHAGVINVLRHARRLTGVEKIYAFVGGPHLTGGLFDPIIGRTVAELAAFAPDVIVPGHCSGWEGDPPVRGGPAGRVLSEQRGHAAPLRRDPHRPGGPRRPRVARAGRSAQSAGAVAGLPRSARNTRVNALPWFSMLARRAFASRCTRSCTRLAGPGRLLHRIASGARARPCVVGAAGGAQRQGASPRGNGFSIMKPARPTCELRQR